MACKPKVELYLERGLDILSNKKELKFKIYQDLIIDELGVIRDQKENKKTLVFKLNKSVTDTFFKTENLLGVRVWIEDKNKNKRIENWDFKPKLTQVNDYKYIIKEIFVKEHQIKKMKLYIYQNRDNKKHKVGKDTLLHKINTYND
ncbi:hypothetical protein GCM10022271_06670 [Corallibacter vietnamensis]|uniref:Uncharacterized protein n=2 Tax=Corallibacter vietnamensis TaxID=904130 RepID=A0ABP7H325_9FLAO